MLNSTTPKHQQAAWQAQLANAMANRAEDVSSMDVFNLAIQKRKAQCHFAILGAKKYGKNFSSFSIEGATRSYARRAVEKPRSGSHILDRLWNEDTRVAVGHVIKFMEI
jgi:hypothetical protein